MVSTIFSINAEGIAKVAKFSYPDCIENNGFNYWYEICIFKVKNKGDILAMM